MGVVVGEFRHQRHAARIGLDRRAHVVHNGGRFVDIAPRHDDPHRLPRRHLHRRPLTLVDLRPHPEHARVGHDEQPIANAGPLAPRDEHILDHAVERGAEDEAAQGNGVTGAFAGLLAGRIGLEPAADERAEILPRDLHQAIGLLERRPGAIAILAGEKPRLFAGRDEVGVGHLQIARPLLDDPPRKHAAFRQRLRPGAYLLDIDQPRIGAENLLAIRPEHTVLELLFDGRQRRLADEGVEQRFDVVGDGGRPVGGLLLDQAIVLAAADLVAGHAHVGAGKLSQRVALRNLLPHLHEHPRHDAIDGRGVIEPVAGVVVEPAGHGEVLAKGADVRRSQTDFRCLLGRRRQGDESGYASGAASSGCRVAGPVTVGDPGMTGLTGLIGDPAEMVRCQPPPGQATERQESKPGEPAEQASG